MFVQRPEKRVHLQALARITAIAGGLSSNASILVTYFTVLFDGVKFPWEYKSAIDPLELVFNFASNAKNL